MWQTLLGLLFLRHVQACAGLNSCVRGAAVLAVAVVVRSVAVGVAFPLHRASSPSSGLRVSAGFGGSSTHIRDAHTGAEGKPITQWLLGSDSGNWFLLVLGVAEERDSPRASCRGAVTEAACTGDPNTGAQGRGTAGLLCSGRRAVWRSVHAQTMSLAHVFCARITLDSWPPLRESGLRTHFLPSLLAYLLHFQKVHPR